MTVDVIDMDAMLGGRNDILRSIRFRKRLKEAGEKAGRRSVQAEKALKLKSSYRPAGGRRIIGSAIYSRAGIKRAKRSVDLTARRLRIQRITNLARNKQALRRKGLSNRRAERSYRSWHKKTYGGGYISASEKALRR